MIISYKHGIYELSHELLNHFRLRVLGNQKIPGKSQNFIQLQPRAQSFSENETLVNTSKKLKKNSY